MHAQIVTQPDNLFVMVDKVISKISFWGELESVSCHCCVKTTPVLLCITFARVTHSFAAS